MNQRQHRRENLADLISDMEDDVARVLSLATVVYDLGSSDNCTARGVQVVGIVLEEVAQRVQADWSAAFQLSRSLREVAR